MLENGQVTLLRNSHTTVIKANEGFIILYLIYVTYLSYIYSHIQIYEVCVYVGGREDLLEHTVTAHGGIPLPP